MMYSANSALKSGNNCLKRIIPHGGNKKVQHSKRQNYRAGEIYNYVLMLKKMLTRKVSFSIACFTSYLWLQKNNIED